MQSIIRIVAWLFLACACRTVTAQTCTIRIFDNTTYEPLSGASIQIRNTVLASNEKGEAVVDNKFDSVTVTAAGYHPQSISITGKHHLDVKLEQKVASLEAVILTANRTAQKRSEAPVAITVLGPTIINETKAASIDQLVNKAAGVFMVNLGNEQHSMSIRQPMSTRSLYLYLEDGIPIRTSGVFNHNALLEMNMAAVKNIEIVRGPASSLYGAEAIGGAINFITLAPPASPLLRLSVQGSDIGYRRIDAGAGTTIGKVGIVFNGYYAGNRNGQLDYSDFDKYTGTLRLDYRVDERTLLTNSVSLVDYRSDMRGGLDSTAFRRKDYRTPHRFTYRDVFALRAKSQLERRWSANATTSLALVFRNNSIEQNPSYFVRDDRRRNGNTVSGKPNLAHGEINDNSFTSYAFYGVHRQQAMRGKMQLVGGVSADISPATYQSHYIRISQDSATRDYLSYTPRTDSALSDYRTDLVNLAAFTQIEYVLTADLRLTAGVRYDAFDMCYDNSLPPSAFSGAPDTRKRFGRFTPKLGLNWQLTRSTGVYANYSQGFVAPQITELFRGVKVPDLAPQTFFNYEAGGWLGLWKDRVYAEWSVYLLDGTNEIISIRLPDGTTGNANAGKTRHSGIEYALHVRPASDWRIRLSAAHSRHEFIRFEDKGTAYDDNTMPAAPAFLANAELTYKPRWARGLRTSLEWQHVGRYWLDPQNTGRYPGFDLFHLRVVYQRGAFELWLNTLNLADRYYATNASKSNFGYSYNIGDPRSFLLGLSYAFHAKPTDRL